MKPGSQTDRIVRFLRANPGASSLEITLATGCVNTTGRISDARSEGLLIECRKRPDGRDGYWLREPRPEPQPLRGTQMEVSW